MALKPLQQRYFKILEHKRAARKEARKFKGAGKRGTQTRLNLAHDLRRYRSEAFAARKALTGTGYARGR